MVGLFLRCLAKVCQCHNYHTITTTTAPE
jgi:hypothetical protein